MPLIIDRAPNGPLYAETPHGLRIALPGDPAKAMAELARLLAVQERRKTLTMNDGKPGITSDGFTYILAEWERAGGTGSGKLPMAGARLPDEHRARPGAHKRPPSRGIIIDF